MNELWTLLNLLMPKLFNDIKDFSSWFVLNDFHGTNDRIINIATKDEILDIIVKVNQINFIYFLMLYYVNIYLY